MENVYTKVGICVAAGERLKLNYRVAHLVADPGWVDLDFECSTVCPIQRPNSAWADGNLAEKAGQVGKMVKHRNPL